MNKVMSSTLASILLLASSSCFADVQISFAGITGELPKGAIPNAISVSSIAMGAGNSMAISAGSTLSAGKTTFSEISFTKPRGVASAGLEKALFSGQRLPSAQLRFTRPGTTNLYFLVTLEDVYVKSWQTSADDSGNATDSFSIIFAKIRTEDVITNPDGTKANVPAGWDLSKAMVY